MEEQGEEKLFDLQKVNIEELIDELKDEQQEEEAKNLVKFKYPCVYIEFLNYHNMKTELNKFIKCCEDFRNVEDPHGYYLYCFGFVLPMIKRKKENNQL